MQKRARILLNEGRTNTTRKVADIHSKLHFTGGSMKDEYPEQLLIAEYLSPAATVLEIGANIGRSTLIISSILEDSAKLVTLETDPKNAIVLEANKDSNNFKFNIFVGALSKKPLVQQGWQSKPYDVSPSSSSSLSSSSQKESEKEGKKDGFIVENIIGFEELQQKYNLIFDTLVLDCEGAFYYILQDFPDMLANIKTIIMENDYHILKEKTFVDSVLTKNGFSAVCKRAGGWGPCRSCFYEVWKK